MQKKESPQERQSKLTQFLQRVTVSKPPASRPQSNKLSIPSANHQANNNKPSPNRSQSNHSRTDSLSSSLSAPSHSPLVPNTGQPPPPLQSKPQEKQHVNVEFYLNKIASRPYGEFIDKMHMQWHNDYQRLQRDHSFIQWLFPNSFQSRFNSHAKPLSLEQAEIFKASCGILARYVRSYNMMLGFYGMKMKNKLTGQLVRSRHPDYKERFHKTLLTSFHNHMRITRILCSLTELGFSLYAAQLCRFLKHEIQSTDGALQPLAKYRVYDQWKPFENSDEKNTNIYMEQLNKTVEHRHPNKKIDPINEKKEKEEQAPSKQD